jgi:hypothetical protein
MNKNMCAIDREAQPQTLLVINSVITRAKGICTSNMMARVVNFIQLLDLRDIVLTTAAVLSDVT